MKRIQFLLCSTMAVLSIGFAHSFGQQITVSTGATGAAQTAASAAVPHLAKFSGIEWARQPELTKGMKEHRAMPTASTKHMELLRKEQQLGADLTPSVPAQ